MRLTNRGQALVLTLVLLAGTAWAPSALADDHVRGVIAGRAAGGALVLYADDGTTVTLIMSDATKVRRQRNMRQIKVSSDVLQPGLRIEASGEFRSPDRFAAERVRFGGSDLKIARAIRGGIDPTDRRSLENQRRIADNARLIDQQQQTLRQQEAKIAANSEQIKANDEKMVATAGVLGKRLGELNDYTVVSKVTVYFANGKASIPSNHRKELQQLAAGARELPGYMVQVQGYASAVGSYDANQRLSMRRADAVAAVLNQNGIPPAKMLVPATMGVSEQVAPNRTTKGQAENRRTVVTLLQNKGISEK
jgi:outer membrane protein OmpA-like peptidoglycan-associated protein